MFGSPSKESHRSSSTPNRSKAKTASGGEEEMLKCSESMDRKSPDLWPEKFPGFREFVANSPQLSDSNREVPDWMKGLEKEDMDLLWSLGKLNPTQIYDKIKSLYNLSVELGVEEEREMVRGRFLNVLGPKKESSDEMK